MRIFDQDADKSLNRITLFLTISEANEMADSLRSVLENEAHHHEHVPSEDFGKEITITVYGDHNLEQFDDRSRQIIQNDT